MNKRHYEHTLPNIRGSLSNTYFCRRLTGKQRIVLTSVVSLLFTAACLYSVVSSVSRLGERKGDMKTGHIRPVMLRPETTTIHSNIQKHENGLSENQGTAGAVE